MKTPDRQGSFYRILVDLNTQCDFLLPGGALPVTNRVVILPKIRLLMKWVRSERIPLISSLAAHRDGETLLGLPSHCIDHTPGQKKLSFTLMPRRLLLQGDNTMDLPLEPFRRHQQIILTKRRVDFLSNPKADRLINSVVPHHWVIFGVTASQCVKATVLGLMARQHRVVLVKDACGYWSTLDGEHAFRQMEAKGAIMVTAEELISGAADERINAYCPKRRPIEEDEDFLIPFNGNGKIYHDEKRTHLITKNPFSGNGRSRKNNGHNGKSHNGDSLNRSLPVKSTKNQAAKNVTKSRRGLA